MKRELEDIYDKHNNLTQYASKLEEEGEYLK
jgi:hypothetical protein